MKFKKLTEKERREIMENLKKNAARINASLKFEEHFVIISLGRDNAEEIEIQEVK